ncbi:hypothetical protein DH2020_040208 [Rehmannia glutinosa]|uniref:Cation/H+ exchanger domain-containing protein n=1 Tax=Rehmannia glutinosa TaxID=99300 RepID=A0ABR0UTS5_REHGL
MHTIFPKWSTPILESVASIGLLFFLFLVGLELDLNSIRRSGRRAVAIAVTGISLTFTLGVGVAFVFRKTVDGADKVGFPQYVVFMGVALSITAFPVLARVLAELKLLTTRVGETAMAAAALNDVAAWISLALAVALAGNGGDGPRKSPLISIWVLLSGVVFVAFMMVAIKPAMKWLARQCSDQTYISLTIFGVLVAGFVTDLIGIHAIFGAFVFGLAIPKGGDFEGRLMERIEDFVSCLLLPLYFASSGLKTDVAKLNGGEAWGLLALVIMAASAGKIIGTFAVAMMCMIPARESMTLGVLMNTKGLVELIVLNIGREKKAYNQLGRVSVRPATAISPLATMHEDICHVAEEKKVSMIILPFHKQWVIRKIDGEDEVEVCGHGWRGVNQRVLKEAPCSVAVLVDRGYGGGALGPTATQNVCVLFFGGPDDGEALELGGRMAEHPAVKVAVMRFMEKDGVKEDQKEHDEGALEEFTSRWEGRMELIEKLGTNIADEVLAIGRSGDYNLIIVGKGWCPSTMAVAQPDRQAEHPELGPIGDLLASSGQGIASSVLVVQQHVASHAKEHISSAV